MTLKNYKMVVFIFYILNKDDKMRLFKENFLLANVKLDIVLKISFLIISNTNINFKF